MKQLCFLPVSVFLAVCLFATCLQVESAQSVDGLTIQAQLVWGTNDPQSPDPKHKSIDAELTKKLSKAPYRWKYYFEVKRLDTGLALGETKPLSMSDKCKIDIKNLGGDKVEVKLYGDGKPVSKHVEKLVSDWPLVLSGDAKNDTAWLVVIQKVEANAAKVQKPAAK
ncbi:MAG: hypothetical protein JWR69_2535 [Pedosphaera sp.]|nr:hypothetical protein [Pedosphaera sp.]